VSALNLDLEALIDFSELVEAKGMLYVRHSFQEQLRPLSASERAAPGAAIDRGLKFSPRNGEPHISRSDVRGFVYVLAAAAPGEHGRC
jgi:hypothetical protein